MYCSIFFLLWKNFYFQILLQFPHDYSNFKWVWWTRPLDISFILVSKRNYISSHFQRESFKILSLWWLFWVEISLSKYHAIMSSAKQLVSTASKQTNSRKFVGLWKVYICGQMRTLFQLSSKQTSMIVHSRVLKLSAIISPCMFRRKESKCQSTLGKMFCKYIHTYIILEKSGIENTYN